MYIYNMCLQLLREPFSFKDTGTHSHSTLERFCGQGHVELSLRSLRPFKKGESAKVSALDVSVSSPCKRTLANNFVLCSQPDLRKHMTCKNENILEHMPRVKQIQCVKLVHQTDLNSSKAASRKVAQATMWEMTCRAAVWSTFLVPCFILGPFGGHHLAENFTSNKKNT